MSMFYFIGHVHLNWAYSVYYINSMYQKLEPETNANTLSYNSVKYLLSAIQSSRKAFVT